MLPKTIDCTFTAVPSRPVMFSTWRYVTARGCIQLLNTASIASSSCLSGSCGNGLPKCFWKTFLYSSHSSIMPSSGTSVSSLALYFFLILSKASSKCS